MSGSEVLEIKRTLDGKEQTFRCTLLLGGPAWLSVRYILPRSATVGPLALPAGAETIAHFWPDRPYTAYHWLGADGRTLGVYLNAASDVEISPGQVRWRDLALDLLITPDGAVAVLDDDEAQRAPEEAQPLIARARAQLVGQAAAIAAEVTTLTDLARASQATGPRRAS